MKRLTTDAPKTNLESALNLFYAKDGEAWVLRGGSEPAYADVTLFDYIRSAMDAKVRRLEERIGGAKK